MATSSWTCQSSLRNYWMAACPFLITAGYLIWYGESHLLLLHRVAPRLDPTLIAPYRACVYVGCVLIVVVLGVLLLNLKKTVILAPDGITCKAGRRELRLAWRDVHAIFPPPHKRYMRTLSIQGGESWIFRIEEFFFPDFNEISEEILEATQKAKKERTYQL